MKTRPFCFLFPYQPGFQAPFWRLLLPGPMLPLLFSIIPSFRGGCMLIADMQLPSSLLLTGPAGQQLGTGPSSLPNRLGPATFEVGIVAEDRSLNPCFSYWIPGPDDGKVSVRSTTLEGMQDFLLVHRSHTWMMWRKDVTAAVTHFLNYGCFEQPGKARVTVVGKLAT